jgi:UDP-N-acetylmuramate--alanine ligase
MTTTKPINFDQIQTAHLIGIKGVGMTSLAACLRDKNIKITGSDVTEVFITDQTLKKMNIAWWETFAAGHISDQDLVIATGSAHQGPNNVEAKAAQEKNIPYITHGQALGNLMNQKKGISVCGVGGKTTTSAIMATLAESLGLYPSFSVGAAAIFPLGLPGRYDDRGEIFIAEADEYATAKGIDHRPRFWWQNPEVIICTNIEYDHPDVYADIEATKKTFRAFFDKIPPRGVLIINGDNRHNQEVISNFSRPVITYGELNSNYCQIKNIKLLPKKTTFLLQYNEENWGEFSLSIPGRHNVFNATAAILALHHLGTDIEAIRQTLPQFLGTKRRFEFLGFAGRRQIWDDYAHHPSQIKATLAAAKAWFGKEKLTVIFQPHTFTRTEKLMADFASSFSLADQVFILPIYDAGRELGDADKVSQELVKKISLYQQKVSFMPDKDNFKKALKKIDQGIIMTMGAGDIWKIGQEIVNL